MSYTPLEQRGARSLRGRNFLVPQREAGIRKGRVVLREG
jgi:hypothetical protein